MNIQDALYHARVQHIRTVVNALGHVRMEKGLTAFENGQSNWSHCFFARAFEDELNLNADVECTRGKDCFYYKKFKDLSSNPYIGPHKHHDPEGQIMAATGIKTRIPIRFVWQAFDSIKGRTGITRDSLRKLIKEVMDQNNSLAVQDLLNSLSFDADKECSVECEV